MKHILRNWKTSLLGSGAIGTALVAYIQNPDDWKGAVGILVAGLIGLFAKDGDKTGI